MKETGYFFNSHTYFPSDLILTEGEYSYFDGYDEGNRKAVLVFCSGNFVCASPMKKNENVAEKISRVKERLAA